jgi:hypothetical protein
MNRRTRRTLWVVAAVLILLAVAIFLRSKAPPEAARLLPESDGIIYFNLRPVRAFFHKDLKPPERVPEYQQFIDAIGIDPERDLDEAAIALHRMPDPNGPNGPVAYSMVLVGKITGQRLNAWLAPRREPRVLRRPHRLLDSLRGPHGARGADRLRHGGRLQHAHPGADSLHHRPPSHAALPFAGSTLLRRHYHDVPLLSLAWGVGQIGLPFSESGAIKVLGLSLPLESDSTIIASLRWTGTLHLRSRRSPHRRGGRRQAAALATLVTLARGFTVPLADNAANKGLKELLGTAEVTQKHDRVVVTATIDRSLFSETAAEQNVPPDGSSAVK